MTVSFGVVKMNLKGFRDWLERRFWEFRHGHSTYLVYAISLFNFITINYYLLITNIPFLANIFSHLWVFIIVFIFTYFPIAILIGHKLFRKHQYKTDTKIAAFEDPFRWKAVYPSRETQVSLPLSKLNTIILMRLAENHNLLTLEEKKQYRKFLCQIDKLIKGESVDDRLVKCA